jgi:hypothetical protein
MQVRPFPRADITRALEYSSGPSITTIFGTQSASLFRCFPVIFSLGAFLQPGDFVFGVFELLAVVILCITLL